MSARNKPALLLCLLLFSAMSTSSYSQMFQWARQWGSPGWDQATALALDENGNVYSAGIFPGTADFDPGPGISNLTPMGNQDIFISKFDGAGNFIWVKQLGGPGWEECHDIDIDRDGNIYLTGFFLGGADWDPSAAIYPLTSSSGGDAFICKLDSSGNFVWARQTGGSQAVTSYSIAVDDSGNVFTTGFFDGTTDFNPGAGTFYLTVSGYSDIFVSKLDASGNFVWAKQMNGTDGEAGYSIDVDVSGNVYTTGTFWGTVDFDPGIGTFYLNSPGEQDIYISKLDASGNFLWAKQMGGDVGYSIVTDQTGHVYASGYFGWDDISIFKLDSSGNITWAKQTDAVMVYSIAIDSALNVYFTGQFFGTGDFDPGAGTFTMTSQGSTDSYISKLDSSGNFVWAVQLGGTDEVHSRALAVDNNGSVYTTGYFNGTADFDPATATFNMTSSGSYDLFLHKLNPEITSVSENNFTDAFHIYPNPTAGNLVIEFGQEQLRLDLVLRNASGQVVLAKSVSNTSRVELQINEASGVYMLEIADQNNHKAVIRIVKT